MSSSTWATSMTTAPPPSSTPTTRRPTGGSAPSPRRPSAITRQHRSPRVTGRTGAGYTALRRPPTTRFGWRDGKLLSLNSEIAHGRHSRQARWLRHKTSTGGNCRIAFWHRPRYSDGTFHGDQPDTAPLWNALKGRTRIVINGHEHDMQAF